MLWTFGQAFESLEIVHLSFLKFPLFFACIALMRQSFIKFLISLQFSQYVFILCFHCLMFLQRTTTFFETIAAGPWRAPGPMARKCCVVGTRRVSAAFAQLGMFTNEASLWFNDDFYVFFVFSEFHHRTKTLDLVNWTRMEGSSSLGSNLIIVWSFGFASVKP